MTTLKLSSLISMRSISKEREVPVIRLNLGERSVLIQVASSGWPFASTVPGQMTHLVASLTPDSASWGGITSPEGFLPSTLLLLVIIVAVVMVVLVVVVVEGWVNDLVGFHFAVIGVPLCSVFLLVLSAFVMVAACASRAAATLSATSFLMAA
ncbi:hypothetical protein Tco_1094132 [Tanacetum coccineum]|uniref:Uncharacterized protein n=1 Tax=Tanacetum coccineum TaxID=301880 RepID=A0ABQ5IG14_9ASTR